MPSQAKERLSTVIQGQACDNYRVSEIISLSYSPIIKIDYFANSRDSKNRISEFFLEGLSNYLCRKPDINNLKTIKKYRKEL